MMRAPFPRLAAWLVGLLLAVAPVMPALAGTTVFAAASLKTALDAIARDYQARTGRSVTLSYAASSALARQIEAGAPADLFLSADLDWMDYLAGKDLIDPASRRTLLANRLVLIGPAGRAGTVVLDKGLDLRPLLGDDGRLAVGDVAAVPAGKYAKAALQGLGAWDGVADRLAQAENVRVALALVARGEAPLGIVYATDARAEPAVRVLGSFPPGSHPDILYPVALTRTAGAEARDFLLYLTGPQAQAIFTATGFTPVER